jgi:sterol desaturase/sphingolipid hydroxylase (fatty acid hydroxylase superfamily)
VVGAGDVAVLAEDFAVTYVTLLFCYVATALAVTRLDRGRSELKIQRDRQTPPRQIRRDMIQSVVSLAVISALLALGWWSNDRLGIGFRLEHMTVGNTIASFVGSMILYDTWFYWFHRLLHLRPFYRVIHRWHHLTVTPVAWSNNSDTMLDNCVLQSYWLVAHLILPISPLVLLAHKILDQVTGTIGHSGYEHGGVLCWPPSPLISVTHHDQHHRYFRCNYGTHFTVWDRVMGTLHLDHDAALRRNIARARMGDPG